MRSLPEKKFWNELRSRLKNYREEPDDTWDAIASRLPRENRWPDGVVRLFSVLVMSTFVFLEQSGSIVFPGGTSSHSTVWVDQRRSDVLPECIPMNDNPGNVTTKPGGNNFATSTESHASNSGLTEISLRGKAVSPLPDREVGLHADKSGAFEDLSSTFDPASASTTSVLTPPAESGEEMTADTIASTQQNPADTLRVVLTKRDSPRRRKFRPAIFAAINPSLAYYKITPNQSDELFITRVHQKASMMDRFSFQFDAGLQHRLGTSFEIFAGLSYYAQHETVSYSYFANDVEKIESSQSMSYEIRPSEWKRTAGYSIRSVGLTAGAFYLLKDNRLSHRLGAGLQYHRGFLGFNDERGSGRSGNNQMAFMIAYRMQTSLSQKVDFFVQSSFTQFVTSYEILDGTFRIKPYRVAIGVGVVYRIAGQPLRAKK